MCVCGINAAPFISTECFAGNNGTPCALPFRYNGTLYHTCTEAGYAGYDENAGKHWCATKVDEKDNFVELDDKSDWDWCYEHDSCDSKRGNQCCPKQPEKSNYEYFNNRLTEYYRV